MLWGGGVVVGYSLHPFLNFSLLTVACIALSAILLCIMGNKVGEMVRFFNLVGPLLNLIPRAE